MKIIRVKYLLTFDNDFRIIKDGAVVFDDKIIEVATYNFIRRKYPHLEAISLEKNSVLMPGLINSHIHLEFSANKTTLKYGNFYSWLNSVIKFRENLINKAKTPLIKKEIDNLIKTGTTTIGAISSYSFDLEALVKSPINKLFFCEVIGSKPDMIDTLFADFKSRLEEAKKHNSKNFEAGIAIHSPYSVHPFLTREVLNIAKRDNLVVSSHFLESKEEKKWLRKDKGSFLDFFKNFLNQTKAINRPLEFLELFKGVQKVSFTHCVETKKDELEKIKELNATINHCSVSNRFLNNSRLEIDKIEDINFSIGTDGLSSNSSLSMFDELRAALNIHFEKDIVKFSRTLLNAATNGGAKALGYEGKKGKIEIDYDADMIAFSLPNDIVEIEDIYMHIILHTKNVNKTIIKGKIIDIS
ncbi:aminofutalosine deaminase family hydrolase [Aliarcobacter thereius]|uniref:Metal-dependent hydrolase n=2 Tax=Aliarcobacter thereius TaxID=544718 RepID=A0A5R9H798_9BACT|nr:metal-dependent hydrolase [Aliarcobacter thereius]OCL92254.1 Aminodeoxyfutalosine deaminase [Aliarcobacter thereius]OCL94650.1 Aminodeoxyfutalosine deaminase [Aliarcobacter thereius LMG 24486]QBF15474.1 metallo-dependent hydrolase, subgroup D [Aliarcobacter thereius LMG 24486]TLS72308.1 metal-dependent hydrolase [Aliarcobacter thereius]TLS93288.1 metal-dependent hydrolase [Aliarcobacter thereius]